MSHSQNKSRVPGHLLWLNWEGRRPRPDLYSLWPPWGGTALSRYFRTYLRHAMEGQIDSWNRVRTEYGIESAMIQALKAGIEFVLLSSLNPPPPSRKSRPRRN
jgi:hypothetical protein